MKIEKKWIYIFAFIFIAIPILLNCVLQWNANVENIIGDIDGPKVWLVFWGTYLAAVGSFAMAGVSYIQSRNEARSNAMRIQFERKKLYYDKMFDLIFRMYKTHSLLPMLIKARSYIKTGNSNEAVMLLKQSYGEIYAASLYFQEFQNVNQSATYKAFGIHMKNINTTIHDSMADINNDIINENYTALFNHIENAILLIKVKDEDIRGIIDKGSDVLFELQNEISDLLLQLKATA